jgi:hypothetical protein
MRPPKPPTGASLRREDPLAKNLAGAWLFNEKGGTIVKDHCGISHGSVGGGASWILGKASGGNGLNFDNVDDRVSLVNANNLSSIATSGFSGFVIYFCRSSGGAGAGRIIDKQGVSSGWVWRFANSGLNHILSNHSVSATAANISVLNQWMYVGFTCPNDGTGPIFYSYRDGSPTVIRVDAAAGITYLPDSTVVGCIGDKTASGRAYDGIIECLYMWNRALKESELRSLFSDPYRMFSRPDDSGKAGGVVAGFNRFFYDFSSNSLCAKSFVESASINSQMSVSPSGVVYIQGSKVIDATLTSKFRLMKNGNLVANNFRTS